VKDTIFDSISNNRFYNSAAFIYIIVPIVLIVFLLICIYLIWTFSPFFSLGFTYSPLKFRKLLVYSYIYNAINSILMNILARGDGVMGMIICLGVHISSVICPFKFSLVFFSSSSSLLFPL